MKLSTTTVSTASRCLKKYEYRYKDGLIPKAANVSLAMRKGTWIHKALEEFSLGRGWKATVDAFYQWAMENGVKPEDITETVMTLELVIPAYIQHWQKNGKLWETVSTEQKMEVEIKGHQFQATIDLLVKENDKLWIVERKSTTAIPRASWRAVDPQTAMQLALCQIKQLPVEGIIFDYILMPGPKEPRIKKDGRFYANTSTTTRAMFDLAKAKSVATWIGEAGEMHQYHTEQLGLLVDDSKFFQRYHVLRPWDLVKQTFRDISHLITAIEFAEKEGYYRRSLDPFSCRQFCQYNELCVQEYSMGKIAPYIREELFDVDHEDARREARVEVQYDFVVEGGLE